jgi:hypothetical protein
VLTAAPVAYAAQLGLAGVLVDLIFILAVVVLYTATHWLILAVSRLGGGE